jgi:WD40 repeat protein
MDDRPWDNMTARFPHVPSNFKIETVAQRSKPGTPIQGCDRPVIALTFSPDATSIAVSGGGLIPGAVDIRVFDVASRTLRKIIHYHCMGIFHLAFDPRTGLLASASHDYTVVLWALDRNDAICLVGDLDAGISRSAAKFVGDKVIVADGMTFGDERAALTAFDLATGDIRELFELDKGLGISELLVLPEEELLIAAIEDPRGGGGYPEIRCVALDGAERARYQLAMGLYRIAIADTHALVATGTSDDGDTTEVFVFDARSGETMARRVLGPEIGASVANAPSGGRVAVAYDRSVEICNIKTLQPELRFQLGDERACSVAWSPDGTWIAVGTLEHTVRLFHATTGMEHLS